MGRRGSITEEQVFQAADSLVAQGKEVTPSALLGALGSGSFTTIYKHLSAWETSRTSAITDRASAIPESVLSAFGAAWRAASTEAGKEIAAVRDQAAHEVETAKAQFLEALQTIERLEAESESDAAQIESLKKTISDLEKKLHDEDKEKSALKASFDQLKNQSNSQESEIKRLQKEKEDAIKEAAELRGKEETLKSQNEKLLLHLSERKKGDK